MRLTLKFISHCLCWMIFSLTTFASDLSGEDKDPCQFRLSISNEQNKCVNLYFIYTFDREIATYPQLIIESESLRISIKAPDRDVLLEGGNVLAVYSATIESSESERTVLYRLNYEKLAHELLVSSSLIGKSKAAPALSEDFVDDIRDGWYFVTSCEGKRMDAKILRFIKILRHAHYDFSTRRNTPENSSD